MPRRILGCACLLACMAGCSIFCTPMGPQPGEDQYERAGCPRQVHDMAHPSDTGRYFGYRVGGGEPCPAKAEPPCPDEGTFGWDYHGLCVPSKVDLGWSHDRYQGGFDGYNGNGPHPLKRFHELRESRGESHGAEGHGEGGAGAEGGGH